MSYKTTSNARFGYWSYSVRREMYVNAIYDVQYIYIYISNRHTMYMVRCATDIVSRTNVCRTLKYAEQCRSYNVTGHFTLNNVCQVIEMYIAHQGVQCTF